MRRIRHSRIPFFIFLAVLALGSLSQAVPGEAGQPPEEQKTETKECEDAALRARLQQADALNEKLRDQNQQARVIIERLDQENRELRETIARMRRVLPPGGVRPHVQ